MEKEKLYHIALDDYEHGVVIRSLNDEKTKLMEEGKSADAVDDLLVKVHYFIHCRYRSGHMVGTSDCTFHKRRIAGDSSQSCDTL